jgi:hypothetical protein
LLLEPMELDKMTPAAQMTPDQYFAKIADWATPHLSTKLPVTGQTDETEGFYFGAVYVESSSLTTTVAGPRGVSSY